MLGNWDEETKSAIRNLAVGWSTYAVRMGAEPGGAHWAAVYVREIKPQQHPLGPLPFFEVLPGV
jgi:hypothetical protein